MLSNKQTIRTSTKKKCVSTKSDSKAQFQTRLNTILTDVVSKLEFLAKEVLPKEELDKINQKKKPKTEK